MSLILQRRGTQEKVTKDKYSHRINSTNKQPQHRRTWASVLRFKDIIKIHLTNYLLEYGTEEKGDVFTCFLILNAAKQQTIASTDIN